MPLLSNKLYILNKIRKDKKDEESTFCHSLTNEICENEEEFNRKTFLYNQKIWTCRITGQINLTFKEALKSEQGCSKMLKNSFKKCFEAAVLQFVHHSKESLDTLIHKAWTQIHQEFCVNEPVTIKLTAPKEMILKGVVVKVDRSRSSEDKEQENSPIKLNSDASSSDKENMKKKIIPVKKNYFYSVNIFEMDKLVKDIPSETIDRTLRPPSKDQIRMFIRAHAIRHSGKQNNPWVVDDDLVKKYRLPVLEPEFVVDKQKMRELSKSTEMQVYNKMKEEHKDNNLMVDLTRSDDDEQEPAIRQKKQQSNESKEKTSKSKKLKQTTLFDVQQIPSGTTANQRNSGSQIRSPLSSPTRSLPPLAQRLLKLMKENPTDPNVKQLIFKCGQLFSSQQISKFPDLIRTPIKERKEKYDEKKRLDAMSPEEREAYLVERRNQLRRQLRDKKREENAKLEDNELEYTKLIPEGSPVPVEDGMSQDQWARLVSVSEFVRCYNRLLVPSGDVSDDNRVIEAHELCESVIGNTDKAHSVLSELVCVLLKTLLQDNRVRNRREMGLGLTELPVTACTAGELLRLVLPLGNERHETRVFEEVDNETNEEIDEVKEHVDDVEETEALTHNNNNKIAGPICDKLLTVELHQLCVEDKIAVLELLQSRILELDVVSSFIDDYQREVCEAYKKRVADTKEFNDKLKAVRQSKQDMCRLIMPKNGFSESNNKSMNDTSQSISGGDSQASAVAEETSQVVRRRQSIEMKMKESEEKERKLEKERQFQKLEKEEQLYKKSLEQCQKAYVTALSDAKQLMRVQPLGTDRHFRRYWHFSTAPGALYVETEIVNSSVAGGVVGEQIDTRWSMHTSIDEVTELLDSLCEKGVRESLLKTELESILPKLKEEFELVLSEKEPLKSQSTEESFLISGFKHELKETEISIRQGSLGGVEEFEEWNKRLSSASTMDEMKQALVSVFLGVHERFWNAPLKSANGRNEFLTAVEQAQTQGRLNVLQSFLDACVCWSKSAKDDKCRVCRKSSDENAMLLCDSCNHAFHTFCLRPPLHEIPEGEWFCPHCKPVSRARDNEGNNDSVAAIKEKQPIKSKTRQGYVHQEQCCVCHTVNNEQLAKCTSCKKCFHSQCHEPPLRQIRRTNWHCCECRLDEVTSHKIKQHSLKRASLATVTTQDDLNSDEDNNSSSNEEKKVKKIVKKSQKTNEKLNGVIKKKPFEEVEKDEVSDEESQKSVKPPNRKRSRIVTQKAEEVKVEFKKKVVHDSDVDESDQDVDNLPSLFAKRSSRKRNSTAVKEDEVLCNGVEAEGLMSLVTKKSKNGLSAEKIEKACHHMLKHLINHKASWPFRDAVDPEEVPDYYQIISDPMNLAQMMEKYKKGTYASGIDSLKLFLADVGQMFFNAEVYNLPDSKIMNLAYTLEEFFKSIYNKYEFGIEYSRMTDSS